MIASARFDYACIEGIERSSIEISTAGIVPVEPDDNPMHYGHMLAEDEEVPHTHIYLNVNQFGIFTIDDAKEIIAELTRLVARLEVNATTATPC